MTDYNSCKNPPEQSRCEENLCDRKVTVILPVTATRYSMGSTSSFIRPQIILIFSSHRKRYGVFPGSRVRIHPVAKNYHPGAKVWNKRRARSEMIGSKISKILISTIALQQIYQRVIAVQRYVKITRIKSNLDRIQRMNSYTRNTNRNFQRANV